MKPSLNSIKTFFVLFLCVIATVNADNSCRIQQEKLYLNPDEIYINKDSIYVKNRSEWIAVNGLLKDENGIYVEMKKEGGSWVCQGCGRLYFKGNTKCDKPDCPNEGMKIPAPKDENNPPKKKKPDNSNWFLPPLYRS